MRNSIRTCEIQPAPNVPEGHCARNPGPNGHESRMRRPDRCGRDAKIEVPLTDRPRTARRQAQRPARRTPPSPIEPAPDQPGRTARPRARASPSSEQPSRCSACRRVAGAANRLGLLRAPAFRRVFVVYVALHLAEGALVLHLLLERLRARSTLLRERVPVWLPVSRLGLERAKSARNCQTASAQVGGLSEIDRLFLVQENLRVVKLWSVA